MSQAMLTSQHWFVEVSFNTSFRGYVRYGIGNTRQSIILNAKTCNTATLNRCMADKETVRPVPVAVTGYGGNRIHIIEQDHGCSPLSSFPAGFTRQLTISSNALILLKRTRLPTYYFAYIDNFTLARSIGQCEICFRILCFGQIYGFLCSRLEKRCGDPLPRRS